MYTLFYYPGNANLAPHMMLEDIGAPHTLSLVDRKQQAHKAPEYLALNPNGRLPTLVDGDLVLYEAAAICLHLADRHPEAGLAPPMGSGERAQFYKWLMWLTNTLQPEMLIFHYPDRHTDDPEGVAAVKSAAERRLDGQFAQIESTLAAGGPYLLGDRFTACDLYLLMICRWGRFMARPPREMPHISALLDRLMERPAVRRTFEIEGIAAPYF